MSSCYYVIKTTRKASKEDEPIIHQCDNDATTETTNRSASSDPDRNRY